jgi:hypothetical protein
MFEAFKARKMAGTRWTSLKSGFVRQVGHKSHRIGFGGSKLGIIVKGYVSAK